MNDKPLPHSLFRPRPPRSLEMVTQIGKLIRVRYGGPCTDDDAVLYYEAALPYLIDAAVFWGRGLRRIHPDDVANLYEEGEEQKAHTLKLIHTLNRAAPCTLKWLRWCTPGLVPVIDADLGIICPDALAWVRERERLILDQWYLDAASPSAEKPFGLSGKKLGQALQIRACEMRAGDLQFISPVDRTREQLAAERREADRIRKQKTRVAKATPKDALLAQIEPWKAAGISRATWFRRRRSGETQASAPIFDLGGAAGVSRTQAQNDNIREDAMERSCIAA